MPTERAVLIAVLSSCVAELSGYLQSNDPYLDDARRFIFDLLEPRTGELLEPTKLAIFRNSEPFRQLIETVMGDSQLSRSVLGQNFDLRAPHDREMFQQVVEIYLFRGLVAAHYSGRAREQRVAEFVEFLELGEVGRDVVVPLNHVSLEDESYDLGEFGVLEAVGNVTPGGEDTELFSRKRCALKFRVTSKKYFGVIELRLVEQIKNKVAAIRMAASPFVSFNRFSISHVRPWEEPLRDEMFSNRFYGRPKRVISLPTEDARISRTLADTARRIYDVCRREKWNVASPWRLALDRLDDAIFRTESGSLDALLDVVIGLESVLVEPQSTQESTHKVAVRAARLLEHDSQARLELVKMLKRLYALRSKIAHGRSLGIDAEAKRLLSEGVRLLTKVLKIMLEADLTELDLSLLDLS